MSRRIDKYSMKRRVAITQPYVPGYRAPLWGHVHDNLKESGIESRVFHGGDRQQNEARSRRGDAVVAEWESEVPVTTFRLFGRGPKAIHRRLPREWRGRDVLLVTEMQASNLDAWYSIVTGRPFITFGHGASGTTDHGRAARVLEDEMNRRASAVLTYTERGRRHVLASTGIEGHRVAAFGNTTDTTALRRAMNVVESQHRRAFLENHGIPEDARIALYLGALNRQKNIDLLVGAARIVLRSGNDWLVVAGDGEEAYKLQALAQETKRIVMMGQASADQYAPAAASSSILLNPGRVGLVAVDALVMGLPILSTTTSQHAPEFDYLRIGTDVIEVEPTSEAFATAWAIGIERTPVPLESIPSIERAAEIISSVITEHVP